jgi:hypothetical protein
MADRLTWAEYARTFSKCYVEALDGLWRVYLPNDTTFEADDIEIIRAKAAEYGCTITF